MNPQVTKTKLEARGSCRQEDIRDNRLFWQRRLARSCHTTHRVLMLNCRLGVCILFGFIPFSGIGSECESKTLTGVQIGDRELPMTTQNTCIEKPMYLHTGNIMATNLA